MTVDINTYSNHLRFQVIPSIKYFDSRKTFLYLLKFKINMNVDVNFIIYVKKFHQSSALIRLSTL